MRRETAPEMFITFATDDPDDGIVLDSSPSLAEARRWMRTRGEGWCYRYLRQADGSYAPGEFVEVINQVK